MLLGFAVALGLSALLNVLLLVERGTRSDLRLRLRLARMRVEWKRLDRSAYDWLTSWEKRRKNRLSEQIAVTEERLRQLGEIPPGDKE